LVADRGYDVRLLYLDELKRSVQKEGVHAIEYSESRFSIYFKDRVGRVPEPHENKHMKDLIDFANAYPDKADVSKSHTCTSHSCKDGLVKYHYKDMNHRLYNVCVNLDTSRVIGKLTRTECNLIPGHSVVMRTEYRGAKSEILKKYAIFCMYASLLEQLRTEFPEACCDENVWVEVEERKYKELVPFIEEWPPQELAGILQDNDLVKIDMNFVFHCDGDDGYKNEKALIAIANDIYARGGVATEKEEQKLWNFGSLFEAMSDSDEEEEE